MSNLNVTQEGSSPCQTYAFAATATTAVITLVVASVLAILVNQNMITLPSTLSTTHVLGGGLVVASLLALTSLAIRYCSCNQQSIEQNSEGTNPKKGGRVGNIGSPEHSNSASNFNINKGLSNDPLLDN